MGQYHLIYNKTKKEYFKVGGAKLWEQAHSATAAALLLLLSNSNGRGGGDFMVDIKKRDPKTYKAIPNKKENELLDIIGAIQGRWAGDSLVVQGDYAEENDTAYIDKDDESYTSITTIVLKALIAIDPEGETKVSKIAMTEIEWQKKLKSRA